MNHRVKSLGLCVNIHSLDYRMKDEEIEVEKKIIQSRNMKCSKLIKVLKILRRRYSHLFLDMFDIYALIMYFWQIPFEKTWKLLKVCLHINLWDHYLSLKNFSLRKR